MINNLKQIFFISLLVMLGLSACSTTPSGTDLVALQKEFERGVMALRSQRYKDALDIFKPMAEDGVPGGLYCLGQQYEFGLGVPRNTQKAIELYLRASEKNYGAAEYRLAVFYLEGGLEEKDGEGVKWLTRAVAHGYYPAYGRMGYLYEHGLGIEPNVQQAVGFYLLGSEREDMYAITNLAKMFYFGDKIKQDYITSYKLFSIATELGHADARYFLGVQFMHGLGIQADQQKAVDLYRLAAEQGHPDAQNTLGVAYAKGAGVMQDQALAVHWYRMAAQRGYAEAQFNLGSRYENGLGVEKSEAVAISWYAKAAKQNHLKAAFNLALLLFKKEREETTKAGLKWLGQAAEQGLHNAQFALGTLYYKGERVSQDYATALKWLRLAADSDNPSAQYMLAMMYEKGQGVAQDISKAETLYEKVSHSGSVEAMHARKWLASFNQRKTAQAAVEKYNLSLQKIQMGDAANAEKLLRTAIKLKTDFVEAYAMLGVALGMQSKLNESIKVLKQAIDINPNYADAHANLGFGLARLGRWQESIKYSKQALAIDQNHERARLNLNNALRMLNGNYNRGN